MKNWSNAETAKLYQLYDKGLTHKQLSNIIGRSPSACKSKVARDKYAYFRNKLTDKEIQEALDLYRKGLPLKDIALAVKRTFSSVQFIIYSKTKERRMPRRK